MRPVFTHDWPTSETEAIEIQTQLATQLVLTDRTADTRLIAGADVAYDDESNKLVAAVVTLDTRSRSVIEAATAVVQVAFPYIPGLFSFRELPGLIAALAQLKTRPDIIICDGQGIAHPRRFGLASHLGLLFDIPTIGCAKTPLTGTFDFPGRKRGDWSPMLEGEETVGAALRTQDDVKPLFISPGHAVSLARSMEIVLQMCGKYRQPETTRAADQLVRKTLKTLKLTP